MGFIKSCCLFCGLFQNNKGFIFHRFSCIPCRCSCGCNGRQSQNEPFLWCQGGTDWIGQGWTVILYFRNISIISYHKLWSSISLDGTWYNWQCLPLLDMSNIPTFIKNRPTPFWRKPRPNTTPIHHFDRGLFMTLEVQKFLPRTSL